MQACTGAGVCVCVSQSKCFICDQSSVELPARPNKDKWVRVSEKGKGGVL